MPYHRRLMVFLWSISVICMAATSFSFAASASAKVHIIDGDTIDMEGKRIRLYGIDAPEIKQLCYKSDHQYPCGKYAQDALKRITISGNVRCVEKYYDFYGRIVAECFIGDTNINALMVEQGWAMAYRRYSKQYVFQENLARTKKRGIWQGEFDNPHKYRSKYKKY